jgi:hypothetical protein
LFGDDHGAEFGGVVGAHATGDHQRSEQGADLAQDPEAGAPAQEPVRAELLDDGCCLDHHDAAHEQRRGDHDRQRFDAHFVEIQEQLAPIEVETEQSVEDAAEQYGEAPDDRSRFQEGRPDASELALHAQPRRRHSGPSARPCTNW